MLAASIFWRRLLTERLSASYPLLAGMRMRNARRPRRQPRGRLSRADPWRPAAAADGPSAAADGYFCVTCSSLAAWQVRADRVGARRARRAAWQPPTASAAAAAASLAAALPSV